MSDKPIIFSAPMVRAILAGAKTQTRRVVSPHRGDDAFVLLEQNDGSFWPYRSDDGESASVDNMEIPLTCPYGKTGDTLWVRETCWFHPKKAKRLSKWPAMVLEQAVLYDADLADDQTWRCIGLREEGWSRRPSIHMPRAASRITLSVTAVRVERLQEMSADDCVNEGICPPNHNDAESESAAVRAEFWELWDRINGKRAPWASNPWVWVITFERIPTHG